MALWESAWDFQNLGDYHRRADEQEIYGGTLHHLLGNPWEEFTIWLQLHQSFISRISYDVFSKHHSIGIYSNIDFEGDDMTTKKLLLYLIFGLTLLITACTSPASQSEVVEQADEQLSATQVDPGQDVAIVTENESADQVTPTLTVTYQPTLQQTTVTSEPVIVEVAAPILSTELARGCQQKGPGSQPPKEGQTAIDFTLMDSNGDQYTLSELLKEKPVVMIFGSFT